MGVLFVLWRMGCVLALLEHYEDLDMDTKQMVPLKRLYWPI
jgi:predicted Mrr-cat superfamily restriction endonuclease